MNASVRAIPLPCGKTAIVSECDYRRVRQLNWSTQGQGYVRARFKRSAGGDGRIVYLHRFILKAPAGFHVDHIDGDTLNNTRENLQFATRSRNAMRAERSRKGGVTRHRNKWRARMNIDGKSISLGCFDTREDARSAVEVARKEAWSNHERNPLGMVP